MEYNIILDLDNTMISTQKVYKKLFNIYEIEKLTKHENFIYYFEDDEYYFLFYERPELGKFLKKAYEYFNLYVFTMANKSYAFPVIEHIEKMYKIKFDNIWTIDDLETNTEEIPNKDINITNLDKNKTFIFDDYPAIWKKDIEAKIIPVSFFNGYYKVSTYFTDDFVEVIKILPSKINIKAFLDMNKHLDYLIDLLFIKN